MRRLCTAAIFATASSLLVVWPAAAATRYASPTGGTEEPCASASPCTLAWAVQNAKEGDEVIVLPGPAYSIGKRIEGSVALNVHGPVTGPLPELDYASRKRRPGRCSTCRLEAASRVCTLSVLTPATNSCLFPTRVSRMTC